MEKRLNVPVLILAGGLGTRISEETDLKPKPMIEVGGIPVLVHIMRRYYAYGFNDFVICAGYRSWEIKNYFLNYEYRVNHLVIDHRVSTHAPVSAYGINHEQERWRVRVLDTGIDSMTGARVARALDVLAASEAASGEKPFTDFALTYGDGLSDVDLEKEYAFHQAHGRVGTVLAVRPRARFGELDLASDGRVASFLEKPESTQGFVNGGFFFFRREFRYFVNPAPECILEREPLVKLAEAGELMSHPHLGFWQPMDTLRDKNMLQGIWDAGNAPWVKPSGV